MAEQLFTFVTAEAMEKPNGEMLVVSGKNNEAERTLRSPAQARGTGRTNKTVAGARRQTVIVSVLESLRQHLPFQLYAIERNRGNPALVRVRPQLFRPMGGET